MSEKLHFPGGLKFEIPNQDPRVSEKLEQMQEFTAIVEDYRVKHKIPRRGMALFLATCLNLQITFDIRESPEGPEGEDDEGGGIDKSEERVDG